jgi:hypothetical protein
MIYLKKYEHYKSILDLSLEPGEEEISIKLVEYVLLLTYKSKSSPETAAGFHALFKYFTKAKSLNIFIDNELISNMTFDERRFNTLTVDDFDISYKKNFPDYIIRFKNLIIEYLLDCHNRIKDLYPEYQTYLIAGKYQSQAKEALMIHDYLEFVENDFKNSNSKLVQNIKKMNDEFIIYKKSTKYNI